MKKYRHRADLNQNEICKQLRQMGISVEKGHDDILVGYRGVTYWFEIKQNEKSPLTPSEKERKAEWRGQYSIVTSLDDILKEIKTTNE